MAFTEDLTVFLDEDDFAVSATVGAATIRGIFDDAASAVLDGAVASTGPQFTGRTVDLADLDDGDTITIDGQGTYKVTENNPDGTGVTVLQLRRA